MDSVRPRLQSEQGPAVVDQIELHVAATAIKLERPFPLPISKLLASLDNRQVGRQVTLTHCTHEGKAVGKGPAVQVIEEQATHPARLAPMLEEEVTIAPGFELGINVGAERLTELMGDLVPMPHVLFERIEGRQVEAATKPPDRLLPSFSAMKNRTFAWLVGT